MKIKLLAVIVVSLVLFACKKNAGSSVAVSIAPVVKVFDGKEYVDTKLEGNPEYYIMYFTASW